jgi:hypothetical protein
MPDQPPGPLTITEETLAIAGHQVRIDHSRG